MSYEPFFVSCLGNTFAELSIFYVFQLQFPIKFRLFTGSAVGIPGPN